MVAKCRLAGTPQRWLPPGPAPEPRLAPSEPGRPRADQGHGRQAGGTRRAVPRGGPGAAIPMLSGFLAPASPSCEARGRAGSEGILGCFGRHLFKCGVHPPLWGEGAEGRVRTWNIPNHPSPDARRTRIPSVLLLSWHRADDPAPWMRTGPPPRMRLRYGARRG